MLFHSKPVLYLKYSTHCPDGMTHVHRVYIMVVEDTFESMYRYCKRKAGTDCTIVCGFHPYNYGVDRYDYKSANIKCKILAITMVICG